MNWPRGGGVGRSQAQCQVFRPVMAHLVGCPLDQQLVTGHQISNEESSWFQGATLPNEVSAVFCVKWTVVCVKSCLVL